MGMSLSYGLSLSNNLVRAIQKHCSIANDIISVERLYQYMHIPSEAPQVIEGSRPATYWPAVGKVEIQDLQVGIIDCFNGKTIKQKVSILRNFI
jgi:ATP-binding cassette subfamily C (CFTR/MRP) protein 2